METLVQFTDRAAKKSDYEAGYLSIIKYFHTVQGEAPYVGFPCVFLRLAGCNRGAKIGVDCEFCETSFELHKSLCFSVDVLANIIFRELEPYHSPMLVITGGEPMLQMDSISMFLTHLSDLLVADGKSNRRLLVQFETNGDFRPSLSTGRPNKYLFEFDHIDLAFVVSPKGPAIRDNQWFTSVDLRRSENPNKLTFVKIFMRRIVSVEAPYNELNLSWVYAPFDKMYLSPMMMYKKEGDTVVVDYERSVQNSKHAMKLIKQSGYRYAMSFQSHVFMDIE